jgi:hypothetical protein
MHNVLYDGHFSYQETIATLIIQYFWSGLKKDVVDYISICMECHGVKVEHGYLAGFLYPLPILERK